jgi:hypothetical protein
MSRALFSADRDGCSDEGPLFPMSLQANAGILPQTRARQLPITFCTIRRCGHSDFCCLLHTGFLLGSLFHPLGGIYIFLRNVGWLPRTARCCVLEDRGITTCCIQIFTPRYVLCRICWKSLLLGPACFRLLMIQKPFLRSAADQKLSVLNVTSFGLFLETRVEGNSKYIVTAQLACVHLRLL